ncbi:uncharacterized protein LOC109503826 isoform X1 [Harpegnathos saltator]|uniref:uncharacterized protein LOC109503826 isoform X1 n=1 Tax=Harpegnathos saltator TaxID=610380 RepID=UPI000DBEE112|nr:uncharacterized protein LOC109503826 isoform X1 [Harpegnathos saltator]XP_025154566.1 uncharacterized protein LOC109503826 isoform X1 [Harpegnathos saltator]XP_025154567.1 uncharacterized protein LOC109503826 isoform X1 [Harpegnathos saltator]
MHDGSKQLCLWPPRTANAANFIANCVSPCLETWNQYEVDVIKSCTSLESARRSAADSNYQTTDEDRLGRGKRLHIEPNRYSSEEEEKENNILRPYKKRSINTRKIVSAIPSFPGDLTCSDIYNINEDINVRNNNRNDISTSQRHNEQIKTYEASDDVQSYDKWKVLHCVFHRLQRYKKIQI